MRAGRTKGSGGRAVARRGDNDPTRFLTYLVAALQTIAANIGAGVLAALHSPQPPPVETLLTALINEIATIPESFVLVLDDYHVLDAKPIDRAVAFLLEHLPPQMHLIIASREDPLLPWPGLPRGQLTELRAADLRFTSGEAAEFSTARWASASQRTTFRVGSPHRRLDRRPATGSPCPARAVVAQGRADTANFIESFTGTHHFMMDDLLEEVCSSKGEVQASWWARHFSIACLAACVMR